MKRRFPRGLRIAALVSAALLFAIALFTVLALLSNIRAQKSMLVIERGQNSASAPVSFTDLLPGDSATARFTVRVAHKKTVTLRFRADTPAENALASELRLTVSVKGREEPVYAGTMSGATNVTLALFGEDVTEDVEYEIVTRLREEAGNELQGASVEARYVWWVEESEFLEPVKIRVIFMVLVAVLLATTLALMSAVIAFLIWRARLRRNGHVR